MIAIYEKLKKHITLKELVIVLLAVILSAAAGAGVSAYLKKDVIINYNGVDISVATLKNSVKGVLDENGIQITKDDYINLPLDKKLKSSGENHIIIKTAVPVNIMADGQTKTIMTYKETVREVLSDGGYVLSPNDRLEGAALSDPVKENMNLKIVRVEEKIVSEQSAIAYNVVTRENDHMDQGVERVISEGREGILEKTYKVVLEDGQEVKREYLGESVVAEPVDKIVEVGTIVSYNTARGGTIRYKEVLRMRATAYTASYEDTGKTPDHPQFGITYTGTPVRKGIVAVDPNVIPLGTRLYIEVIGDIPDYGYAIAADIGAGVKGDIIDLYMEEGREAVIQWGIRPVNVYILAD